MCLRRFPRIRGWLSTAPIDWPEREGFKGDYVLTVQDGKRVELFNLFGKVQVSEMGPEAGKKERVIALFDVDDTLTPARKEASVEMLGFLQELRKVVAVGIVGVADLVKISEQLGKNSVFTLSSHKSMNGSRETQTRWKGKNAREIAQGDPIAVMYETMKDWEAPSGLFADSAVLLVVDGPQAQLLSRACFGRSCPPAVQPISSVSSASTYPPPVPEEGMQLLQLGLEEAFFLNYELKCIEIYGQTPEGRIKLHHEDSWKLMERSKKQFAHYYKAYSHLRSKRWVVLSGIQYGADFMAYRHHPALVHSDYAVLVMVGERKQERLSTWTDLHSMQRLCGSVAKTLLLLHVISEVDNAEVKFPFCLDIYHVEAVEVERWIPKKHREDVGLEEKMI